MPRTFATSKGSSGGSGDALLLESGAAAKLTALSEISVPALEDLAYFVDDPGGTPASLKATFARLGGLLSRSLCQGRLTTESGVPLSLADRTAQGTLYFTPYLGTHLSVYDGTRWKLYAFSQLSLSLSVTADKIYDVFVYDNAGTLTLELSAAWANDTTPTDALTTQDGIPVKSGATTRRWIGTIRASGSNITEDSFARRFVWNAYNQVWRIAFKEDTTGGLTYGTNAERDYAGSSTATFSQYVIGASQFVDYTIVSRMYAVATNSPNYEQLLRIDGSTLSAPTNQLYVPGGALSIELGVNANTFMVPRGTVPGYHSAIVREIAHSGTASPQYAATHVKFFG